ncbi:MAG: hypothetical protein HUJ29_12885 [Gammaproteobacteria bacterium]|nr:hypothetical protein [Gammaproteobacteria bacterium]
METWESVVLGIIAIVLLIWLFPGVKERMLNSPKGSASDWKGLAIPLLVVVLFIVFLISLV